MFGDIVKNKSILEKYFYHDGRGPELQKIVWSNNGAILEGFEYYNPDDTYNDNDLKHLKVVGFQVVTIASEEVHANIQFECGSNAAIIEIKKSEWFSSYNPRHLLDCKHFQIMFYDEIIDLICEKIIVGKGKIKVKD